MFLRKIDRITVITVVEAMDRAVFLVVGSLLFACLFLYPATTAGQDQLDWGRVRASFTGGVQFSKEHDEFSQQDLYLGFNLDKNWRRGQVDPGGWKRAGMNSFFETRLAAILSTAESQTGTQPATTADATFLASRKAAMLQGGFIFPS